MQDVVSSSAGEKAVYYPIAVIVFAVVLILITILMVSARQQKITVSETFRDGRDWYGLLGNCPRPLVWESLEADWIKNCVSAPKRDDMRAYRLTFKIGEEEKVVTMGNWEESVAQKRIFPPIKFPIVKNNKMVYADVFTEAQHASFII